MNWVWQNVDLGILEEVVLKQQITISYAVVTGQFRLKGDITPYANDRKTPLSTEPV